MVLARKVIKALKKDKWILISQKGSHKKFKKENIICIIPDHKGDIPNGTLTQIEKITGLKFK